MQLSSPKLSKLEGTPRVKCTSWSAGLVVAAAGVDAVGHAGDMAAHVLVDWVEDGEVVRGKGPAGFQSYLCSRADVE